MAVRCWHGQPKLKHGSTRLARELDEAAVAADEVLSDREAEPGASGLTGHERIDDGFLELIGDAGSVVLDLGRQHEAVLLRAEREVRQSPRPEDHSAALADGLHRVARD